ncbi:restriction endonuclease subunit S [Candidatus Methanoliparum sp. LAM-1]|uniref:restriction endonuclease subunit S n=1 Tax=Candidatus Methanoliparum sp. LAM-1 TaxID=2874846 RepID=UPI001E48B7C2|nr:restriction endonuclease subunit S [Candidatus Methanoliparum sp. LAM-1]BDC35577.1 restriction endonuclease subunit S [Candidatus Methanoliparum sp. LAM-1]
MEVNLNQNEEYKETELGLLPQDWEVVRLGDIAKKMRAGGTPKKGVKEYWNGEIPFVLIEDMTSCGLYLSKTKETITEEGLKNSNAWLVPENSLLLSMYATIGETAINTVPVATNQAILTIIPKSNFDNVFGAYLLKFNAERLKMQNIQSTQKNVNKGIVENFKIPLPPLSEQKKIAFVLSTVQEAIEKTEGVIKATKELKKSMMKHLFTYGPVPIEEAEHVPLKETELGLLPKDWEVVRLGDKGHFQYGYTTSATEEDTGTKFLRITDIKEDGVVNWDTVPYGIIDDNLQKFKLFENDILFARIGATTGKACIIEGKIPNAVFASYLIRFISNKELNPKYVFYFTQTREYQELVNAGKEGKLKKGLSATELKNFKIPLPPLSEQKKIASILSAIDQKIEAEENKKKALEDLFKSMLHNLMTAKVRVNNLED